MKKKLLTLLLATAMFVTMMPAMAFAGTGTPATPHKWVYDDWKAGSGTVTKDAEDNVVVMKGAAKLNQDNAYEGPYAWDDQQLKDGKAVTALNVYIDPAAMCAEGADKGDFGASVCIGDKDAYYRSEIITDFRPNGAGAIVFSAYNQSNIGTLTEAGVYTIQWTFTSKAQGEGTVVYGKVDVIKDGTVKLSSKNFKLIDNSSDNTKTDLEYYKTGYVWFYNIDVKNGVRVFTELPTEKTFQEPYKYSKSDWVLGDYGDVEGTEDEYVLLGGDKWASPAYATAPYTKKGSQKFDDGNLAQELNAYVNVEDEDSYVDNDVKFAFSSMLKDRDGNRATEVTYCLQKSGNKVVVLGTDIEITESGIYTFRIEYSRDLAGIVYSQLKVFKAGTAIGTSEKVKQEETDKTSTTQNTASYHGYLWVSSLNLKNGLKVYKNVPAPAEKVTMEETATVVKGETITLNAVVTPEKAEDKTLTWKSSAEDVATVEDGVVTGVKVGKATITATTVNGKKAECIVTVKRTYADLEADEAQAQADKLAAEADKAAAEAAQAKAEADKATAEAAQAEAEAAQAKAEADKAAAEAAQAKAEADKAAAEAAKTKAEADKAEADKAQKDAEAAKAAAEKAQKDAEAAQAKAEADKAAAEKAQKDAEAAKAKAEADKAAAEKAQAEADKLSKAYLALLNKAVKIGKAKTKITYGKSIAKAQVKLTWNEIEGADGYVLTYKVGKKIKKLTLANSEFAGKKTYTITGLKSGQKVKFYVKGYVTLEDLSKQVTDKAIVYSKPTYKTITVK